MSTEVPKKRVIFCTYSSIYSSIVLKRLLSSSNIEVVAVINSTRVINPKYGFVRGAIEQIKTSGWRYSTYLFFVTDLAKLLKPSHSLHGLAKQHKLPLLDTVDINSQEAIAFIESKNADNLLAAHFNQLVKQPLLDMNCINIHPSLLPELKGVDPAFYAILRNQNTGVSLHKMAETFDTGDVLSQTDYELKTSDTVFSVNCTLFYEGAGLAIDWLNKAESKLELVNSNGCYDSWPNKLEMRKFKKSGKQLINFVHFWKVLNGNKDDEQKRTEIVFL